MLAQFVDGCSDYFGGTRLYIIGRDPLSRLGRAQSVRICGCGVVNSWLLVAVTVVAAYGQDFDSGEARRLLLESRETAWAACEKGLEQTFETISRGQLSFGAQASDPEIPFHGPSRFTRRGVRQRNGGGAR